MARLYKKAKLNAKTSAQESSTKKRELEANLQQAKNSVGKKGDNASAGAETDANVSRQAKAKRHKKPTNSNAICSVTSNNSNKTDTTKQGLLPQMILPFAAAGNVQSDVIGISAILCEFHGLAPSTVLPTTLPVPAQPTTNLPQTIDDGMTPDKANKLKELELEIELWKNILKTASKTNNQDCINEALDLYTTAMKAATQHRKDVLTKNKN